MKNKKFRFLLQFSIEIASKVERFYKFWWLYRKNHIKIYQKISSFYLNKDLNLIDKGIISSEKWELQVIIFNPSHYIYIYVCIHTQNINSILYTWFCKILYNIENNHRIMRKCMYINVFGLKYLAENFYNTACN